MKTQDGVEIAVGETVWVAHRNGTATPHEVAKVVEGKRVVYKERAASGYEGAKMDLLHSTEGAAIEAAKIFLAEDLV